MSEDGGRDDHLRVVAALENFQVGAAGKRGLDANADFAGLERRRRDFFKEDFFFSVEDGGFHAGSLWARTVEAEESFSRRTMKIIDPSIARGQEPCFAA